MPPKKTAGGARGRPKGSSNSSSKNNNKNNNKSKRASSPAESSNPFESPEPDEQPADGAERPEQGSEEPLAEPDKSVPPQLVTRVLHDLFAKDATRISRDANAAVAKYVDVFVREAIARAAVDKRAGFLEVEDLEKIAPQLLLDL